MVGIKIKPVVTRHFKIKNTFTLTLQCFKIKFSFSPQSCVHPKKSLRPGAGHVGLNEGAISLSCVLAKFTCQRKTELTHHCPNPIPGMKSHMAKWTPHRGTHCVPPPSCPRAKGQVNFKLTKDNGLSFWKFGGRTRESKSVPLSLELENIPGGRALKTMQLNALI